ncbi:MAG TPA: sigma-70 family RNA polymerase sigma factor [Chthonomonadaceae bacterium]|nr:sigma-70 family RNA polymerase sigma factor [Chthonomonadaceae bacterium]
MGIFSGGQRRQFERLVKPLARPLFHAALRLTRQTEWAEDLTQDTLIRAYERFAQFAPGTNFRAWLFTIMTHIYLNDRERARRRPLATASLDAAGEEGTSWEFPSHDIRHEPEAFLLAQVLDEELQAAVDRLPEEFRLAVLLVDVEEMSYQEAAEALKVPIGTVRSRVSRGRAQLRQWLCRAPNTSPS